MFSDFIDGIDQDLQSHRDRENNPARAPAIDLLQAPGATPGTAAKFDLDELDFADE